MYQNKFKEILKVKKDVHSSIFAMQDKASHELTTVHFPPSRRSKLTNF